MYLCKNFLIITFAKAMNRLLPSRLLIGICLLVSLLLTVSGCLRGSYPPVLSVADSLSAANPGKAIALLDSLRPQMEQEREPVRMYYALLCIKARDKAYLLHTSDSLARAVLHYYENRNDRRHLPEAYYYAGRVMSDLGDAPQALHYFEKALEVMPPDDELLFRGKVLSQMGWLFYHQKMYPEALERYRKSLACDSLMGDSMGMAYDWRDIGDTYLKLRENDNALASLLQAHQICEALQDTTIAYTIQHSLAKLYAVRKDFASARLFVQRALQGATERTIADVYVTAGIICQTENRLDSAAWYYNAAIRQGSVFSRLAAYGNLGQIRLNQGDAEAAIQYLKKYLACSDSIQSLTHTEGIRRIHALYNYQLREKENNRLKAANARKEQRLMHLSMGIATLLACAFFVYRKQKKTWAARLRMAELLKKEAHRRSEQFIRDNQKEIARLQAQIQQQQQQLQGATTLRQQLENQKEIIVCTNQQIALEQDKRRLAEMFFFNSDIYKHFKQQLQTPVPHLTALDWETLQTQLDACYDNFTRKLNGLYRMSEREMQICLLVKAKFSNTDIGHLTNLSLEGVSSVRRRLYQKVFQEKGGAKDWDTFLLSL